MARSIPLPAPSAQALASNNVSPAMLRRLEWRLRNAVETVLTGDYRSSFRGRGMEFDQVVKYAFGDDIRDIDWNVTARLGEPYRKKFVEEREVCLLLVFEDSPALQFGSGQRTRRDALLELASLLMLLGAINRDRVGLLYASPAGFWFRRPLPGRETTLHTASLLLGAETPDLAGESTVEVPWRFALQAAPRHSILLWLGPFAPGAPEPGAWPVLRRRYKATGFRADDPWDRRLPADARLPVYDPLAGRILHLDTSSSSQRAQHATWVRRRDEHFAALFPGANERLAVRTDEPVFEQMVTFFHKRGRPAASMAEAAR
jgi:uncharacterized protein (DUF58 family)